MRLEPLYRVEFTYPEGWSIELAGEHGTQWQDFYLAEGACTGRIAGRMRGANHPGRRTDGTFGPDFQGVIETADGAEIFFDWRGYGRAYPAGRRQIVVSGTHLAQGQPLPVVERRALRRHRRGTGPPGPGQPGSGDRRRRADLGAGRRDRLIGRGDYPAGMPNRELAPPPGLEQQVACVWIGDGSAVRVLPDACVDIVWTRGELVVAGPATGPDLAPATPGQGRCGVRFRVGAAGAALGLAASELLDEVVPLAEIWGAEGRLLEERVALAERPLEALVAGVYDRVAGGGDELVREAVFRLRRGEDSVERLARATAVSERQLRRRFDRGVGYGPRTLRRVLRFQRFLGLARGGGSLARLAADAGYADQAHLARDCRRLAGATPLELLAGGAGPAGERANMAETFKPGPGGAATVVA